MVLQRLRASLHSTGTVGRAVGELGCGGCVVGGDDDQIGVLGLQATDLGIALQEQFLVAGARDLVALQELLG